MKNILLLILGFIITLQSNAQTVHIVNFEYYEAAIVIDLNRQDKTFSTFYLAQYDGNTNLTQIDSNSQLTLVNVNNNCIVISDGNTNYTFSINTQNNCSSLNQFPLMGLAKHYGNFQLVQTSGYGTVYDAIIFIGAQPFSGSITCDSGGVGSSACSTESSPIGSAGCSVTCKDGYYACCDVDNICKCLKDKNVLKKATFSTYGYL